jgi:hypothetical protein
MTIDYSSRGLTNDTYRSSLMERSWKSLETHFTRPRVLFALAHICSICAPHDKSLVTMTPRSRVSTGASR